MTEAMLRERVIEAMLATRAMTARTIGARCGLTGLKVGAILKKLDASGIVERGVIRDGARTWRLKPGANGERGPDAEDAAIRALLAKCDTNYYQPKRAVWS